MTTPLQRLAQYGQSVWIDYLSRPFLRNDLPALIEQGVVGVTSNPTIFQGAIAEGDTYDDQLREVLADEPDAKEVFLALAQRDIRAACDLLRPVFDRGDSSRDGWVSLEVDPNLADDTEATLAEALRLHALIDRPNLFVKIPGTEAGLPAIEEAIARGVPVNVTLLFSLDRHRAAAQAYLQGLRRRRAAGADLHPVASVASFFVSRVDTAADRRLDEIGGHEQLKGTLAVANAKLAYQAYREIFVGPEWDELVTAGASPQRCLWASTGVKNPDYLDVKYIEELIGTDTVTTMPRETVKAFADHGHVAATLERDLDRARHTMNGFADAGVDYHELTAQLEREGVAAFASSFRKLFDGVAAKRDELINA